MAKRTAAWRLVAWAGICLVGCGGQAFSVAPSAESGVASGSASGASGGGARSGASGGSAGEHSGASGGSGESGSAGSASGSHSGSGGSSTGSGSGNGSGASGASGSPSDGGVVVSCPIIAPNAGAICTKAGLQCEYGTSPDVHCNQVAVCQASSWSYASASNCPMASCPLTYAGIQAGGHCAPAQETCAYHEGTCICSEDTGGPVRVADASIVTSWACFAETLACRSPRPDIGEPCTDDARKCDYGACLGGVELVCTDGLWQEDFPVCALAN
jgi:hypothetical protein